MNAEEKQKVFEEFETWIKHPYTKRVLDKLKDMEVEFYRKSTDINLDNGRMMRALLVKGATCAELAENFKKPLVSLIEGIKK